MAPVKCDACGEEIALAKVCPYCGHQISREQREKARRTESHGTDEKRARGAFRGSIDPRSHESDQTATKERLSVGTFARFLFHPRIPVWRKLVALSAVFYVLSPLDLLPGAAVPVLGWFDDMAVIYIAWQWILRQLRTA